MSRVGPGQSMAKYVLIEELNVARLLLIAWSESSQIVWSSNGPTRTRHDFPFDQSNAMY